MRLNEGEIKSIGHIREVLNDDITVLEEKLKEKTKPRCKKCGGELSLWQVGTPLESMKIFCYKCMSDQFSISFEEVMQLIYKKYEEAN